MSIVYIFMRIVMWCRFDVEQDILRKEQKIEERMVF